MNIHLTKHFEEYINDKITSGRYNNASEVVRAGLRALEQQEKLAQLQLEIEKGYFGELKPFDGASIKKKARALKQNRADQNLQ
ncbi:type II toxin-antitoxin system ParD family antitoxin [Rhodocytophaga aerolata]|uniref:Type II toxin-antitoxin system ParD family antitoxin n=1 Tax=Rhodocytophaga aerolata TaxID=455078 RepID=A0ABT8RG70_9BACT|nr:type II toxin-antitoxin system ParD family antitoxin [Rhodocytophaga aerolata]MDO1451098.1 type II toxin-antitoxin system ParD family antitoxin [Rhodocytophaga aerolata]